MPLTRRTFLTLAASGAAGSIIGTSPAAHATAQPKIRAIAFDAFTTFDPRPIIARAEQLYPGRGAELANAWRTRQFEYAWLRTLTGRYINFWRVTEDALVFAAQALKLDLPLAKRQQLLQSLLDLRPWPDAVPAIQSLQAAGIRMAFLSNFTAAMLDALVHNAGLVEVFEPHLSTDRVRAYKPDPRAYQMGVEAFRLPREEIAFAAFGGWDAAGAKAFGYPTFWVNRMQLPVEQLGIAPDAIGTTLHDLEKFVRRA